MRFWTREIAGWLLVGLGLFTFYTCYRLLTQHYILEGGPLTVVGIFLFRGGIHLLKVAVAARICAEARGAVAPESRRPPATKTRKPWPQAAVGRPA